MLGWEAWNRAFKRIVRRIVLGDGARDDEELSDLLAELMSQANGLPGSRSEQYEPFMELLDELCRAGREGQPRGPLREGPARARTCGPPARPCTGSSRSATPTPRTL